MNFKRIVLLVMFLLAVTFSVPKTSKAFDLQETLTSENSIFVRIQENLQYFFTFKTNNKVQVLENQAERRLTLAQIYADKGNEKKVQDMIQNYLRIKDKQNDLLEKINEKEVLSIVAERTIEQQKTMEEIKTKINDDGKQNVVQVQEQVVNQVAEKIVVVNGTAGQTDFFDKVEHVWAPGTGPGGTAGVVYEGGSKLMFAPGTSGGGAAGSDIKTVEVKTGGVVEEGLPPGVTRGDGGTAADTLAPGTTNTIDPGSGLEPGTTLEGKNELAP